MVSEVVKYVYIDESGDLGFIAKIDLFKPSLVLFAIGQDLLQMKEISPHRRWRQDLIRFSS